MTDQPAPTPPARALTREERLAQRLRENLRRRKVQARAMDAGRSDEVAPENAGG